MIEIINEIKSTIIHGTYITVEPPIISFILNIFIGGGDFSITSLNLSILLTNGMLSEILSFI